jgi:hypothetical protein
VGPEGSYPHRIIATGQAPSPRTPVRLSPQHHECVDSTLCALSARVDIMGNTGNVRLARVASALVAAGLVVSLSAVSPVATDAVGSPARNPDLPSSSVLWAVDALKSGDAWAVGEFVSPPPFAHPLTRHWDGTTWSKVHTPGRGMTNAEAVDAISSNDVWVVGAFGDGTQLALHWNGVRWKPVATPTPGYGSLLGGVSAATTDDVWRWERRSR